MLQRVLSALNKKGLLQKGTQNGFIPNQESRLGINYIIKKKMKGATTTKKCN